MGLRPSFERPFPTVTQLMVRWVLCSVHAMPCAFCLELSHGCCAVWCAILYSMICNAVWQCCAGQDAMLCCFGSAGQDAMLCGNAVQGKMQCCVAMLCRARCNAVWQCCAGQLQCCAGQDAMLCTMLCRARCNAVWQCCAGQLQCCAGQLQCCAGQDAMLCTMLCRARCNAVYNAVQGSCNAVQGKMQCCVAMLCRARCNAVWQCCAGQDAMLCCFAVPCSLLCWIHLTYHAVHQLRYFFLDILRFLTSMSLHLHPATPIRLITLVTNYSNRKIMH